MFEFITSLPIISIFYDAFQWLWNDATPVQAALVVGSLLYLDSELFRKDLKEMKKATIEFGKQLKEIHEQFQNKIVAIFKKITKIFSHS